MIGSLKKSSGMPWKGRAYLHKKYPLAFPLSDGQLEILDGLAKNGPTNSNRLRKSIGKAYSFVFNTLKELELRKMVTFRREKNEKGIYAKIYDLTLEGVMLVLQREMSKADLDEWNLPFIRRIIEKNSTMLPLVFGKWTYLSEAGFESIILTRLKITVDTHRDNPFRRGTGFYNWLETEHQITRFFYLFDFYRLDNSIISGFDFKAWITALKRDEEIRAYAIQELEYDQRRLKDLQVITEKIISFFESPEEKDIAI